MQTRLKLAPEQAGQLNTILDETRASFQQVRERMKPEMDAIRDGQAARIRAMLNDTQRDEYEKMRRERDENMKKAGPGGQKF
jgi:gas vesicle protein